MSNTNGTVPTTSTFDWSNLEMNMNQSHRAVRLLTILLLLLSPSLTVTAQQADNEYQTGAVLWMQTSGERAALSYQAFSLARMMLDRDLRTRSRMRRAVIVDIDETIMDNGRNQAWLIKNQQIYNDENWLAWVNRAEATAIPGAVEFLNYASSRGVRVFYITNRKAAEKEGTAANLRKLGFPKVDDETLLVRTDTKSSSKEPRRQAVSAKYRVVLLMGDNLNDFSDVFENAKTSAGRMTVTEQNKAKFGSRFIVLPNPMYGDWENAIYDYNFKLKEDEKAAKRKAALKD
ncbi:MAG TPA: 5'-nucleotidase, lipoprotein e(P4) family [Pyrinomonadaceae bacterium]|nr:5'-nucleotidase, lipoprotein e(P4) family [Pyrinomonadaceae bacterium]